MKMNQASDILLCYKGYFTESCEYCLFNDQEKLDNEAAGQTLPSMYQWMKLMNGKSIRFALLPCLNE